jgi:hypothetical protein
LLDVQNAWGRLEEYTSFSWKILWEETTWET